jgi:hypothetical protein
MTKGLILMADLYDFHLVSPNKEAVLHQSHMEIDVNLPKPCCYKGSSTYYYSNEDVKIRLNKL